MQPVYSIKVVIQIFKSLLYYSVILWLLFLTTTTIKTGDIIIYVIGYPAIALTIFLPLYCLAGVLSSLHEKNSTKAQKFAFGLLLCIAINFYLASME